jgi:hypothetical protein
MDILKVSKVLHHYRHVGLDLSLCFYVHFQVTGCLLKNVCPTCGTKRYVKLSDFPFFWIASFDAYGKLKAVVVDTYHRLHTLCGSLIMVPFWK